MVESPSSVLAHYASTPGVWPLGCAPTPKIWWTPLGITSIICAWISLPALNRNAKRKLQSITVGFELLGRRPSQKRFTEPVRNNEIPYDPLEQCAAPGLRGNPAHCSSVSRGLSAHQGVVIYNMRRRGND